MAKIRNDVAKIAMMAIEISSKGARLFMRSGSDVGFVFCVSCGGVTAVELDAVAAGGIVVVGVDSTGMGDVDCGKGVVFPGSKNASSEYPWLSHLPLKS